MRETKTDVALKELLLLMEVSTDNESVVGVWPCAHTADKWLCDGCSMSDCVTGIRLALSSHKDSHLTGPVRTQG